MENNNLPIRIENQFQIERLRNQLEVTSNILALSKDNEFISFFLKNPYYFISFISQYYPLNENLLIEYQDVWDWVKVTSNIMISWNKEMKLLLFDKTLFINENINETCKWSVDEINEIYKTKIKNQDVKSFFARLSKSKSVNWNLEMIKEYRDKWDWLGISGNTSINWTTELIEEFENDLNWDVLCAQHHIWTESLIDKFMYKVPWVPKSCSWESVLGTYSGITYNTKLEWTPRLLEKYKDKISWGRISAFDYEYYEYGRDPFDSMDVTVNIAKNPNVLWTQEIVHQFNDLWDFNGLSENEYLPWTMEFIEKYRVQWNWRLLSYNKKLCWSEQLIDKYIDNWNWKGLSKNTGIPWTEKTIKKYEKYIDWLNLSGNPSLPWSEQLIDKYIDKWHWGGLGLSGNSGLHLSIELLNKYKNNWSWCSLSTYQEKGWSYDIICAFKNELYWGKNDESYYNAGLSSNENLPWSEKLIDRFVDKWNWKAISCNKGIHWTIRLLEKYKLKLYWYHIVDLNWIPWSIKLIENFKKNSSFRYFVKDNVWMKAFLPNINENIIETVFRTCKTEEYLKKSITQFIDKNNYQDINAMSSIALHYFKNNSYFYFIRGLANFYVKGKNEITIENLLKCIEIGDYQCESYYNIGRCKNKSYNFEASIDNFNLSIKVNPNYLNAYFARAKTLYRLGNKENALSDFDKIIKLGTKSETPHFCRGTIFFELNEYDAALKEFNKTIDVCHNNYIYFKARADLKEKMNDIYGSIRDLSIAIGLEPEIVELYLGRAKLYMKLKEYENAISDFTKCFDLNKCNYDYLRLRAEAKMVSSNYSSAIEDYSKIIKITPHRKYQPSSKEFNGYRVGHFYGKRGICEFELGNIQGACDDAVRTICVSQKTSDFKELSHKLKSIGIDVWKLKKIDS